MQPLSPKSYLFIYFGYQKLSFPSSLLLPSTLLCVQNFNNVRPHPLFHSSPKKQTPETWAILIGSLPTLYMRLTGYIYYMNFIEAPNQFIYVRRAL